MTPDLEAVTQVLNRYAGALDRRAWDDLGTVFTADASADFGPLGGVREGVEAITRFCRRALEPFAVVQHFITNVRVDGTSSSCYFFALHVRAGEREPFVVAGTYDDVLVETAGGWRIASRRLIPLWQR